jgi:uncharacterized protein YdiU (UPF0061 family)
VEILAGHIGARLCSATANADAMRVVTGHGMKFDNAFVKELPADKEVGGGLRQVSDALFSFCAPSPCTDPVLVALSPEVCEIVGISAEELQRNPDLIDCLAGNRLFDGSVTFANCYGGHQFGNWSGQLGDGRAIHLGDVVTDAAQLWELQLKGAGTTPYSRGSDGRAVLRSSIREFLCSEAMAHLGIPTTRALSLVTYQERVVRDMFYDNNMKAEPGAICCRAAPSFLRFGSFQMLRARDEVDNMRKLVDFVIDHHYKDIAVTYPNGTDSDANGRRCIAFVAEVIERTARLYAQWQGCGFVHGVLNTDNNSILGSTTRCCSFLSYNTLLLIPLIQHTAAHSSHTTHCFFQASRSIMGPTVNFQIHFS